MRFTNRSDAGRQLAKALSRYRGKDVVVLALLRGGVPVAYEIATRFDAPIDLVLVRKIGVPIQPELAMGAVVDGAAPLTVRNEDVIAAAGVTEGEFAAVRDQELAEIRRRRSRYLGNRRSCEVKGRVAIVVDDGIATGATMRAALRSIRGLAPANLVLAVPVAPSDTLASLGAETDEVVCLEEVEFLSSIGAFYANFDQTSDDEVTSILARTAPGATTPRNRAGLKTPSKEHSTMSAPDAKAKAATRDELKHVLGEVEDAKTLEILALRPTVAELEEALLWASGDGDVLGKAGHPLTGQTAKIHDILVRDEEAADNAPR